MMMHHLRNLLYAIVLVAVTACIDAPADVHTGPLATPLEENAYAALTTHGELEAFVDRLGEESDRITVETLGTSVEGRRIPYMKISNGTFGEDEEKLRVLVFAQQHGNEPSGKEAALMLARDAAAGLHDDLLEHLDILLVPQVNPDGGERHQRRNAEDVDLNRSHFILNAPETVALRTLFHDWMPEVTLDVHEYQPWVGSWMQHGYIRLFDEQYGVPTNINTAESIRTLAEDEFLPYVESRLDEQGFSFHNYLVGSPDYVRYSTTNVNDGRQSFAMLSTFSLILEGRRPQGDDEATEIERRAAAQLAAIEALLTFSTEHKDRLQETVHEERETLRQGAGAEFVVTMDRERTGEPLTIPVHALVEENGEPAIGDTVIVEIEPYYPTVAPRHVTTIPEAYLIPAGEEKLIDLFEQHRIEMEVLDGGQELSVEEYSIEDFEEQRLGNTPYQLPVVTLTEAGYTTREGDVLISTTQLARNLIATALEPRSKHGVLQYAEFSHLGDSATYPILRVTER